MSRYLFLLLTMVFTTSHTLCGMSFNLFSRIENGYSADTEEDSDIDNNTEITECGICKKYLYTFIQRRTEKIRLEKLPNCPHYIHESCIEQIKKSPQPVSCTICNKTNITHAIKNKSLQKVVIDKPNELIILGENAICIGLWTFIFSSIVFNNTQHPLNKFHNNGFNPAVCSFSFSQNDNETCMQVFLGLRPVIIALVWGGFFGTHGRNIIKTLCKGLAYFDCCKNTTEQDTIDEQIEVDLCVGVNKIKIE